MNCRVEDHEQPQGVGLLVLPHDQLLRFRHLPPPRAARRGVRDAHIDCDGTLHAPMPDLFTLARLRGAAYVTSVLAVPTAVRHRRGTARARLRSGEASRSRGARAAAHVPQSVQAMPHKGPNVRHRLLQQPRRSRPCAWLTLSHCRPRPQPLPEPCSAATASNATAGATP